MLKKFLLCSLVSLSCFADDISSAKVEKDSFFYLKYGTGASISMKSHVNAPANTWDASVQGYSASLGTRPILNTGFGYEFCPLVATDVMASYRPDFKYSKVQTGIVNGVAGFLGNNTRKFTLDVSTLMTSVYLNGLGIDALKWDIDSMKGCIYPFIGAGVGISRLTMFDFLSTGIAPLDASVDPQPAFASENAYKVDYRFTYQVMAGFEYRYQNQFALSLGYRWFHINTFKGPHYIRTADGTAVDVGNNGWSIPFAANEVTLELKVLF